MNNLYFDDGSIGYCGDSYYGGYRTRTFSETFPNYSSFRQEYEASPFAAITNTTGTAEAAIDLELTYYLLYARYGNSHSAFSDTNQFQYNIFATIFQYGPSWATRLSLQKKIRALGEEAFVGSEATYNSALNPETSPSTDSREGIGHINTQNKTLYTKSKLEGYAGQLAVLEEDVTETFLSKFRKHFIKIAAPDYPLLYTIPNVED